MSGKEYAKFGGNTSCLEVRYDDAHFIIDAGTGIRPLGDELMKSKPSIQVFLSHTHWDHLIGFPFFAPLYSSDAEITIWSPTENNKNCQEVFDNLLSREFFPVRLDELKAKLHFRRIDETKTVKIGPLTLRFHEVHHPSTAFSFKIETPHQTIGYASDNEMFKGYHGNLKQAPEDHALVKFFTGCDLLIHEAQYTSEEYRKRVGWGHSSVSNAVALIHKAKIGRWLVVHHDPAHTDEDLMHLEVLSKNLLDENDIPCRPEWIGDGHLLLLN